MGGVGCLPGCVGVGLVLCAVAFVRMGIIQKHPLAPVVRDVVRHLDLGNGASNFTTPPFVSKNVNMNLDLTWSAHPIPVSGGC